MPASPCPVLSGDESDTSSDLPEIFSNNASDSDDSTAPSDFDDSSESESEPDDESDNESEDELALEDEEEQLSPEYYLQEAESLDVSQLRQKRYSPKTQERLDEAQDFWDRWDITAASPHTGLGSLIVLGSVKAQSAIRWNVCPGSPIQRRLSASSRLSFPGGVTSDGERMDVAPRDCKPKAHSTHSGSGGI
jgi:hypothetical protein